MRKLGVQGFMSKGADPKEIAEVVRTIYTGPRWIADDVREASVVEDSPMIDLEADVLRETREGYSVKHIALRLHFTAAPFAITPQKTGTSIWHDAARAALTRGRL